MWFTMKKTLPLLLVAGGIFLWGCSGSDDPTGPTPGTNEVRMQGNAFNPATLTIAVGDTVTWTNDDNVSHTVSSGTPGNKGGPLNSGFLSKSGTFKHPFNSVGTFIYFCEVHPGIMRDAKIIVQ
jgi:plastocyanin